MNENQKQKYLYIGLFVLSAIFILESLAYIFRSTTYLDEGHHWIFSLLVYQGKIPYLDFWYYHSPLAPYIYGLSQYLFGPSLILARFTSFFFTALTLLLVYKIAKRLINPLAGIIALSLIIFNPFSIRHFNSMNNYPLATSLLLLSLYLIILEPKKPLRVGLSVFFMTLATGVRLSMGAALLTLMIYIFITEYKKPVSILMAVITAALTFALLWGPFLFLGWDETIFGNIGWYLNRTQHVIIRDWSKWNLLAMLSEELETISDVIRYYPAIVVLLFTSIIFIFWNAIERKKINFLGRESKIFYFLLSTLLALFLVHYSAKPPQFPYILYFLPIAAILTGYLIAKIFLHYPKDDVSKLLLIFLLILLVLTPLSQGKNEVIPKFFGPSDIDYLKMVGGVIKDMTNKDDEILTFTQQYAVQAQRSIISGLEMSYFAFVPGWDSQKCKKYHLYNTEILLDYINSKKAKAIVLADLDYKMFGPNSRYKEAARIWELVLKAIDKNYYLARELNTKESWVGKTYLYLPKI